MIYISSYYYLNNNKPEWVIIIKFVYKNFNERGHGICRLVDCLIIYIINYMMNSIEQKTVPINPFYNLDIIEELLPSQF
jgi:hypothetical protein